MYSDANYGCLHLRVISNPPLILLFQGVCNSVLGQASESLIPNASSTCSQLMMAPIAQSAEGVSWVLMAVGPLMAEAGGLDLGRGNKPHSSFSEDLACLR